MFSVNVKLILLRRFTPTARIRKAQNGFTLVNLLTVIAIGGILTSLSIVTIFSSTSAKLAIPSPSFSDFLKESSNYAKSSIPTCGWELLKYGRPSSVNVIALRERISGMKAIWPMVSLDRLQNRMQLHDGGSK